MPVSAVTVVTVTIVTMTVTLVMVGGEGVAGQSCERGGLQQP